MAFSAAYIGGSVIGGLFITALIGWMLIRLAKAPKGVAFFFAWVAACLIGTWGASGDGGASAQLPLAYFAYGVGAAMNYFLARRSDRKAQEVADFE